MSKEVQDAPAGFKRFWAYCKFCGQDSVVVSLGYCQSCFKHQKTGKHKITGE